MDNLKSDLLEKVMDLKPALKSKNVNLGEGKFYTDKNIIDLPIFSASKRNEQLEDQEIVINTSPRTVLNISYGNKKKLTFFDRKILAFIEYIFCKKENFNDLRDIFEKNLIENIEAYLEQHNLTREELSVVDEQTIIYRTGYALAADNAISITFRDINTLLNDNKTYSHSKIKASIENLNKTTICENTTYKVGEEYFKSSGFPLISYFMNKTGKTHKAEIFLSPFHFFNLLSKQYVASNIHLLTSFKSPIAGRLSEFVSKRLYGSKKFNKDYTRIAYEDICNYLHLRIRPNISLIKQQLEVPLNELIEKNVIENWKFSKQLDLFGVDIEFYYDWNFYSHYLKDLPFTILEQIDQNVSDMLENDTDLYHEINDRCKEYMKNVSSENRNKAKVDYFRYIYYTEYF